MTWVQKTDYGLGKFGCRSRQRHFFVTNEGQFTITVSGAGGSSLVAALMVG